jgi:pyridoxamine 5'-phosphate oxidase
MEAMSAPTDPASLRRSYERAALDESSIAPTWLVQLQAWYDDAVVLGGSPEPNAMQVATVDAAGRPSVRTVLAKGIDERGIVFYTNYGSVKGRDLDERPYAAAVFVWLAHERQVRISGPVRRVSHEETAAYFTSRPRGSQLGAWASPQSQVIASRAVLEQAEDDIARRFGDGDIDVPPHWGGFLISPESVEFWQGRPDRLHDRLRFRLDDGEWILERLAP